MSHKKIFVTPIVTIFLVLSSINPAMAESKDESILPAVASKSVTMEEAAVAEPLTREQMLAAEAAMPSEAASPSILSAEAGKVAKPKPEKVTVATAPVGPSVDGVQLMANTSAKIGRVFMTSPAGETTACSASTVNNDGKNMLLTAAHCAYNGGWMIGNGWKWTFVPGYNFGNAPYGQWQAKTLIVPDAWVNGGGFEYDMALALMFPLNGTQIVNRVGGLGLQWGGPIVADRTIMGYPSEGRFDGERQYFCYGRTNYSTFGNNQIQLNCDMTRGSSGSPWLVGLNVSDGTANGVVSRIDRVINPTISISPYFATNNIGSLYSEYRYG